MSKQKDNGANLGLENELLCAGDTPCDDMDAERSYSSVSDNYKNNKGEVCHGH